MYIYNDNNYDNNEKENINKKKIKTCIYLFSYSLLNKYYIIKKNLNIKVNNNKQQHLKKLIYNNNNNKINNNEVVKRVGNNEEIIKGIRKDNGNIINKIE